MKLFKAIGKFFDKMVHTFDHLHEPEPEFVPESLTSRNMRAVRQLRLEMEAKAKRIKEAREQREKSFDGYFSEYMDTVLEIKQQEIEERIEREKAAMDAAAKAAPSPAPLRPKKKGPPKPKPVPIEERPDTYGGW